MPTNALRSTTRIVAILFGLVLLGSSTSLLAQSGSAPKNLRVTGVTDWTVSLRWDAPGGKVPTSYVVQCSNGKTMTVPGSQTTAVFSNGFDYRRTYTFRVYAVNGGSWSGASNQVTATLLSDTTPPEAPVVSSTGIGPTHVDLAWTYSGDDTRPVFEIYMNGERRYSQPISGRTNRIVFLSPDTNYTFQVRARDSAGNWSEISDPFTVTTPAADPNDDQGPTTPDMWGGIIDGDIEAMVSFASSTDDVTAQEHIRYYLYLNGEFDGATVAPYRRQFSMYLERGIVNTIEVFAVDEAGNRSVPATMTIDMRAR